MTIEQFISKVADTNGAITVDNGVAHFQDGTSFDTRKLSDVDPDWPPHLCSDHKNRSSRPAACKICQRIKVEQMVVAQAVRSLIEAGYKLVVDDSGAAVESGFRPSVPTDNVAEILAELMQTDDDYLLTFRVEGDGVKYTGRWVHFVYGNDGYDVISDYTTSMEPELVEANNLAETLGGY